MRIASRARTERVVSFPLITQMEAQISLILIVSWYSNFPLITQIYTRISQSINGFESLEGLDPRLLKLISICEICV